LGLPLCCRLIYVTTHLSLFPPPPDRQFLRTFRTLVTPLAARLSLCRRRVGYPAGARLALFGFGGLHAAGGGRCFVTVCCWWWTLCVRRWVCVKWLRCGPRVVLNGSSPPVLLLSIKQYDDPNCISDPQPTLPQTLLAGPMSGLKVVVAKPPPFNARFSASSFPCP